MGGGGGRNEKREGKMEGEGKKKKEGEGKKKGLKEKKFEERITGRKN